VPTFQDANPVMFVISLVLQVLSLTYGAYYFLVSLFGWYNKKGDAKGTTDKTHTFALVVAAHNEEAVIANMVKSLNTLNYPREAYDIFVIADNCDDNTAAIAREAGALVYERTNTELRGKGYALEWMFEHIFNMEKHYDSISIFDADNLVNKEYLAEMNKELNKGYKVVQGYIDSKTPLILGLPVPTPSPSGPSPVCFRMPAIIWASPVSFRAPAL